MIELAEIYAMLGDVDAGIALLEHSLKTPNGISVGRLRLDPVWDPFRGDARFQALLNEIVELLHVITARGRRAASICY